MRVSQLAQVTPHPLDELRLLPDDPPSDPESAASARDYLQPVHSQSVRPGRDQNRLRVAPHETGPVRFGRPSMCPPQ